MKKSDSTDSEHGPLVGKVIVLGVTGSIAAYKAADLVRRLTTLGAEVHVTLTRGGEQFVTAVTLRTLSGNPVVTDMFADPANWDVMHVALAQRAEAVVVAPASANAIAKLAGGLADEFLYTLVLATRASLLVAPAMNDRMYEHPATQANLARLRERGATIIEPETGWLACRSEGRGRLAETECIVEAVQRALSGGDLAGVRVLITAGPTREPLDPVRFISNRSSGKMGYALAAAAVRRGAKVTVVSGPTALAAPAGCEMVAVETAAEMLEAVLARLPESDVIVGSAAVADYTPAARASEKGKRAAGPVRVELTPTTDIVAECGRRKRPEQFLVAFAAETNDLIGNARKKLAAKRADMIVANDVSRPAVGMEADRNAGYLLFPQGEQVEVPEMDKQRFAEQVWDAIVARLRRAGT